MAKSHSWLVPLPAPPVARRQKFTPHEDALLRSLVAEFDPPNWQVVARSIPGRTARQCRERYRTYLCQEHVPRSWTAMEDDVIERAIAMMGQRWAVIAKLLPGRRCIDVKNRWHRHIALLARPQTFQDELEAERRKAACAVPAPEFPRGPHEIGKGLFVWNDVVGRQLEAEDDCS
jgi:hypothetical protein